MNKKLKELRNKKNLTVTDMANMLNISRSFYSDIENGKRGLSYVMAVKIAKVFNRKPDFVFYDDNK